MNGTGAAKPRSGDTVQMPKRSSSHLLEAKISRIMESYIGGTSMREIARKEGLDRKTVRRIIASPEMRELEQELVQESRTQLFGLAKDAVDAVGRALQEDKDPRVALMLLHHLGVFPSRENPSAIAQPPIPITPLGMRIAEVMAKNAQAPISPASLLLSNAIAERHEIFNMPLPEALREAGNVTDGEIKAAKKTADNCRS